MRIMVEPQQVVHALTDELGLGPVVRVEPVEQGWFNEVFRVELGDRSVFVRINRDREAFPRELAAYQRGADCGMPVPDVVAYLPHSVTLDAPMLVLGEITGEPLGTSPPGRNARQRLHEQAGAMLRRLHAAPIDGYGTLTLRDGVLRGASSSWRNYWLVDNTYDRDLEAIARDGPVSGSEWARVERAIDTMVAVEVGPARFLHNDFHGAHIFTDGRAITGVIDFGNALAGDPRYDIAMARYFCEPFEAEAFTRGYGDVALDPMVQTYGVYVAAIKVLWSQRTGNEAGVEWGVAALRRALTIHSGA